MIMMLIIIIIGGLKDKISKYGWIRVIGNLMTDWTELPTRHLILYMQQNWSKLERQSHSINVLYNTYNKTTKNH